MVRLSVRVALLSSAATSGLAGEGPHRATLPGMNTTQPFTRAEPGDLAAGARVVADIASEDAKRTGNPEIRESFERTERSYRELAAKCERQAREPIYIIGTPGAGRAS
jgi:hypothetical protein